MKRAFIHIIVCLLLFSLSSLGQDNNIFVRKENNPELKVTVTGYFGISLMTTYTGFVRYGFIQIKSTGEEKITWLSREQFIQQATGQTISKANPDKKNFLEEKEIIIEGYDEILKNLNTNDINKIEFQSFSDDNFVIFYPFK